MKLSTALIYSCNVLLWATGHAKEKDNKVPASLRKLMDDTNGDDHKVSVIAFLEDRFNTDQVAHFADKNEKAAEVLSGLQNTAKRSQQGLLRSLNANPYVTRVHSFYINNAVVVDGDMSIVEMLEKRPDVKSIMNNVATKQINLPSEEESTPPNPFGGDRKLLRNTQDERNLQTSYQWNIEMVGADRVHAEFGSGSGAVVANQDTGIRYTHEILRDSYRGGAGASVNHNYNWFDGVKNDIDGSTSNVCGYDSPVPCDDDGHGTHCLGTSVGTLGYGVAPGSQWIGCRNMDSGWGSPETYLACFEFFLAPTDLNGNNADPSLRPHVIGNSWSCPASEGCQGTEFAEVIGNLKAAGVATIMSAANSGPSCQSMGYPAVDINVISVGSVTSTGIISSFSSRGPIADGRLGPTLSAPGSSVRSAYRNSDTSYSTLSGTSMASPHVTGAWALVASICPSYAYDVDATEALLLRHTQYVADDSCGSSETANINNVYGHGILDIYSAISECFTLKPRPSMTPSTSLVPTRLPSSSPTKSPMVPTKSPSSAPSQACGNGVCDLGEDCSSCPGDCIKSNVSPCNFNGICEVNLGEDCQSCSSDCNGKQNGNPRNQYCCGGGADCTDSRCSADGKSCSSTSNYCCGDNQCEGPEDSVNCAVDCGSPPTCGDGNCDLPSEDSCNCSPDCGDPVAEICGDGIDNDCDGLTDCDDTDCTGDPTCSAPPTGCNSNGICEPILGEDCLSCADDCNGKQNQKPADRFCCGDGDGEKPVSCADSRCTQGAYDCA